MEQVLDQAVAFLRNPFACFDQGPLGPVRQQLDAYGEQIIQLSNPDLDVAARPTANWPMTRFSDAVFAVGAYLLFIIVFTPLMKAIFGSAEPQDSKSKSVLRKFLTEPVVIFQAIYNPAQVALCGYMMYRAVEEYFAADYVPVCNKFDQKAGAMAAVVWIFYISKIFDFFDTIFIILRRKWRQLSFLHVYHHTSIFLFYWLNINAAYDGDVYYTVILNSFVHLVMYFYYFLTTFNVPVPGLFKRLVTNIQLFQFFTMISQAAYLLFFNCPYPRNITIAYFAYICTLIVLFLDFKRKTYAPKATTASTEGGKKKKTH